MLLRPSAAHSAIGKISISEAPPPRAAPLMPIARASDRELDFRDRRRDDSSERRVTIAPIGNKRKVIETEAAKLRDFAANLNITSVVEVDVDS